MLLKTSLLSAVVGLLGSTGERGVRAGKGNDQLVFLCSVDTLTPPSLSRAVQACVLMAALFLSRGKVRA